MRKNARKGATAAEMALLAPAFFVLLLGTVEMSLVLAAQQLMENAAFNTSRLAKTGYTEGGQTQMQTVMAVLNNELGSFGNLIDTSEVTMTSKVYTSFSGIDGNGGEGLGAAQEIVVYTFTYPWKFFTPLVGPLMGTQDEHGHYVMQLQSRIVVHNEPYDE